MSSESLSSVDEFSEDDTTKRLKRSDDECRVTHSFYPGAQVYVPFEPDMLAEAETEYDSFPSEVSVWI